MCICILIETMVMDHWQTDVKYSHVCRDLQPNHTGLVQVIRPHYTVTVIHSGFRKRQKDTQKIHFLAFFTIFFTNYCVPSSNIHTNNAGRKNIIRHYNVELQFQHQVALLRGFYHLQLIV